MTTTYSLDEYAHILRGSAEPHDVQWLVLRLRRGELPGYKAGRKWRATQADVDAAIESLRPQPVGIPQVPAMTGLTRTSARRMAS